jgi:hypothetical protein
MTTNAISLLQQHYWPESYWPEDYVSGAERLLNEHGLLAHGSTVGDLDMATTVLDGLSDMDVTDVFPLGVVWAFRAAGVIAPDSDLDALLRQWREWEETDHYGESLDFLPPLS